MNIQKVKIVDQESLSETIINVPCNDGEKILCKEPYVIECLNKYRAFLGEEEVNGIVNFENASKNQLVNDAVVKKENDSYNININKKYDYKIPVSGESEDVSKMFDEGVNYKMPVAINKLNGITISIGNSMKLAVKNELISNVLSNDKSSAYPATIKKCVNEGYMVDIQGIECFMPGSTASLYKLKDYESILGRTMMVIPISYSQSRDKIVVSHVKFLEAIKPLMIENILRDEKDNLFKGVVTLKKHDYLLITFNECLTGKLSFADMDDATKELFKSNKIEIEQTEVEFYIDYECDGLLTLTQTYFTRNLWDEKITNEFKTKTPMDGVIIGITTYNIIVQLKYNVIGTLGKGNNNLSVGDKVKVKISNIDTDKRKIKLYI